MDGWLLFTEAFAATEQPGIPVASDARVTCGVTYRHGDLRPTILIDVTAPSALESIDFP